MTLYQDKRKKKKTGEPPWEETLSNTLTCKQSSRRHSNLHNLFANCCVYSHLGGKFVLLVEKLCWEFGNLERSPAKKLSPELFRLWGGGERNHKAVYSGDSAGLLLSHRSFDPFQPSHLHGGFTFVRSKQVFWVQVEDYHDENFDYEYLTNLLLPMFFGRAAVPCCHDIPRAPGTDHSPRAKQT